jgi:putative DNA methylase
MTYRKKLIEVALPLDAINKASAREKSIRHGHPSTLHLWWARRPLAAARAVIFAQMVDDPSANPDLFPTEKKQEKERQRLFKIIEDLVQWENTTNEEVLERAREEIWQSWRRACAENADHPRAKELFDRKKLPAFHDPFAGGGALPLEAQRLGLEAYASDLNPIAVLINKAMIEIPPKFANKPPVNPEAQGEKTLLERKWRGAEGLAEDVRYYSAWIRAEAAKRVGHLYPSVTVTTELAKARPDLRQLMGTTLRVVAWIWARTVKSPNPAFRDIDVPLASTFLLSTKKSAEAYVEPVIKDGGYKLLVRMGKPTSDAESGTKLSRGANFRCIMSDTPIGSEYIYSEARAHRMGVRLMATVTEGEGGRVYLSPDAAMEEVAHRSKPTWQPDVPMPENPRWFSPPMYGLKTFGDIFTPRQLVALTTFSELVQEAHERVRRDAVVTGMPDDGKPLSREGASATAYADAVAVYLGLSTDRLADRNSSLCGWDLAQAARGREATVRNVLARQAVPMVWDFAEVNILGDAAGGYDSAARAVVRVVERLQATTQGHAFQADAARQNAPLRMISTDPPYYDNIGYADLSDFFYVWLRRSLQSIVPDLFTTVAVPKAEELVATPYRHGSKEKAEAFFHSGMTQALHRLAQQAHPAFPVTVYYAFKQSESESEEGVASTGWETFLDAVIRAGFSVTGTWPVRTELSNRMVSSGTNALASSIVLVCRPRVVAAATATRREFVQALKMELPPALVHLQRENIAPVDLAQAAIGPGMAVFTRYARVLDAEGRPVPVREALALINQTVDEVLAQQEGDFDGDTRWALAWFEQSGFAGGEYGVAETLSTAKNTSVGGLVDAGIAESKRGKVRLLPPDELPDSWDPSADGRLTVWEMVHHLIRVLEARGEGAAAELSAKLGARAEVARELAYRLYTLSERKKRSREALRYNTLVQSWPEITRLAKEGAKSQPATQRRLFAKEEG